MPREYDDDRWRDRDYGDADDGAERRRPRSRSRERERHHHHHHHRSSHHDHDRDRDRDRDRDYRRGDRDDHYGRRRFSRSRSRSRGRGYDEPSTTTRAPAPPQPQSRPGIFQYIASATGNKAAAPNAPPPAPLAAPAFPEGRPKPNADRLGAMLRGDERMNRRMDERERCAARERLRGLEEGEREGRYGGGRGRAEREGALIRDGFSKGVVDRVAAKKRPYQCDAGACEQASVCMYVYVCVMGDDCQLLKSHVSRPVPLLLHNTTNKQSFAISVELVEHLRRAHGIHRHPSQIVAKPVLP